MSTPPATLGRPDPTRKYRTISQLAETVCQELLQAIRNDQLVLPTLPEAALRIRDAAQHPIIGDRILHQWNFPESLASIPSQHLNFSRNTDEVDYADVIQVAVLQSYHGSDHLLASVDWSQVAAFAKLGLEPEMDGNEDDELASGLVAALS